MPISISIPALRALVAAGVTAEAIVDAIEAQQAEDQRKADARRLNDRERTRRARGQCPADVRDVTRTSRDTPSLSMVSPITPSLTIPPRGDGGGGGDAQARAHDLEKKAADKFERSAISPGAFDLAEELARL